MRHPRRRRSWIRMPRWYPTPSLSALCTPWPGHRPVNTALPPRRSVQTRPQSCPCQASAGYPAGKAPGYSAYEAGPAGLAVSRAAVWHARAVCPAPVTLLAAGTTTVPPAWLRPDCLPGLAPGSAQEQGRSAARGADCRSSDTGHAQCSLSLIRGVNGGNPSKPARAAQLPPPAATQPAKASTRARQKARKWAQVGFEPQCPFTCEGHRASRRDPYPKVILRAASALAKVSPSCSAKSAKILDGSCGAHNRMICLHPRAQAT